MNPTITKCGCCEKDISDSPSVLDPDLKKHVCLSCARELVHAERELRKRDIRGVHFGPYSGNSVG